MATPTWDETKKAIRDELTRLFPLSQRNEIRFPDPISYQNQRNVEIQFPGFIQWLRDFAADRIPILQRDIRTLRGEVQRYQSRKRMYDGWVIKTLDTVHEKRTGKAVFHEIGISGKTLTITPYERDYGHYNATADADETADATAKGMPIRDTDGDLIGGTGTGRGSDANIDFTPGIFSVFETDVGSRVSKRCNGCRQLSGPGTKPDEVLIHEMIHACRDMRGVSYLLAVNMGYKNEEEYVAVVLTNVYLSEKGQTQMRANHATTNVLKDPHKFLDDTRISMKPRVLLERLRLNQPALFQAFANIPWDRAQLNPVKQYAQEIVRSVMGAARVAS